jgi:hypothetical protein
MDSGSYIAKGREAGYSYEPRKAAEPLEAKAESMHLSGREVCRRDSKSDPGGWAGCIVPAPGFERCLDRPCDICFKQVPAMRESMMKSVILTLACISFLVSCAPKQEVMERAASPAPVLMPGTDSRMTTAGFWIGAHADPDRTVIPAEDIAGFNRTVARSHRSVHDLSAFPVI